MKLGSSSLPASTVSDRLTFSELLPQIKVASAAIGHIADNDVMRWIMIDRGDRALPAWWPWFLVSMGAFSFTLAALIG